MAFPPSVLDDRDDILDMLEKQNVVVVESTLKSFGRNRYGLQVVVNKLPERSIISLHNDIHIQYTQHNPNAYEIERSTP